MKTLILNGSPRPNGDTAALLRRVRAGLAGEYKVVDAYRCDIAPCQDCRFCWQHGGCAIRDGMGEVYDYIQECDSILIASPIYFSELTGKLLDVCSRLQTYHCARHFRRETPIRKSKRGAVLLVGGGDGAPDKAFGTARTVLRMMNCQEVCDLVCSHRTDTLPAGEDEAALAAVDRMVAYLNREGLA